MFYYLFLFLLTIYFIILSYYYLKNFIRINKLKNKYKIKKAKKQ